jgi:hypothetical protein
MPGDDRDGGGSVHGGCVGGYRSYGGSDDSCFTGGSESFWRPINSPDVWVGRSAQKKSSKSHGGGVLA